MADDVLQNAVAERIAPPTLARSIAMGGIGIALFVAALAIIWTSATTIFLLFAGILFGLFLNALTDLLGRVIGGPHPLRLAIVCIFLTALIVEIVLLGGNTIAQQANALADTLRSQLGVVKTFLEQRGVDTSLFNFAAQSAPTVTQSGGAVTVTPATQLPSPSDIASRGTAIGGAIVGPTIKFLLGLFEGFANIFIVVFLGLLLAIEPKLYTGGALRLVPAKHRAKASALLDDLDETLRRWLLGQLITMISIFAVVWIGLALIGIPGALVLGAQAGLLSFIPTIGSVISGVLIVLASLGSGWTAIAMAFGLYVLVQFLEGNILTPIIQRHAIDIPAATLFGAQIFLGVLFGLWGLALALPMIAIIKVALRHFYDADAGLETTATEA